MIVFQMVLISIQIPLDEEGSYFEKMIFSIFSPIQHGVSWVFQKTSDVWEGYFSLRGVHERNRVASEEMSRLSQENLLLREYLKKFKNEEEVEKIAKKINENVIHARLIGLDSSNFYKSLVINKGSLDGISKDMVVLDRSGNLVGRVIEPVVFKEARVQLITDNTSGVSVYSQSEESIGILTGEANGLCRLKYILTTDSNLQKGDTLITTGYDGIFLPGIPVGEIISVTTTSGLFQEIKVMPFFNFRSLSQMAILQINPKELF
jgi:rod shape-determining protein MreC